MDQWKQVQQLIRDLLDKDDRYRPGARWLHYKGEEVEIVGLFALHADQDPDIWVGYKECKSGDHAVRPMLEWTSLVAWVDPEGKPIGQGPRYQPEASVRPTPAGGPINPVRLPRQSRTWREELLFRANGGVDAFFKKETESVKKGMEYIIALEDVLVQTAGELAEVSDLLAQMQPWGPNEQGRIKAFDSILAIRNQIGEILAKRYK